MHFAQDISPLACAQRASRRMAQRKKIVLRGKFSRFDPKGLMLDDVRCWSHGLEMEHMTNITVSDIE